MKQSKSQNNTEPPITVWSKQNNLNNKLNDAEQLKKSEPTHKNTQQRLNTRNKPRQLKKTKTAWNNNKQLEQPKPI